jgi:hypothetical protein
MNAANQWIGVGMLLTDRHLSLKVQAIAPAMCAASHSAVVDITRNVPPPLVAERPDRRQKALIPFRGYGLLSYIATTSGAEKHGPTTLT